MVADGAGRSTAFDILAIGLNVTAAAGYDGRADLHEGTLKRIVIIEDNAMAANIYQATLQRQGFSVDVAADGEKGLASVTAARPDLVLMDLMLPKMDGVELLKRIRANEDLARIPIVVMSNAYTQPRLDALQGAGATKIVPKAKMSPKQLLEIVQEVLDAAEKAAKTEAEGGADEAPGNS